MSRQIQHNAVKLTIFMELLFYAVVYSLGVVYSLKVDYFLGVVYLV